MAILKKGDGTVVATDIERADTFLKKTLGVMFRRRLPQGFAMIFDMGMESRAGIAIHMLFVFVPLDVIYLDRDRRIVDIKRHVRPWIGLAWPKKPARYAIEMPAGAADGRGLKEGDQVTW